MSQNHKPIVVLTEIGRGRGRGRRRRRRRRKRRRGRAQINRIVVGKFSSHSWLQLRTPIRSSRPCERFRLTFGPVFEASQAVVCIDWSDNWTFIGGMATLLAFTEAQSTMYFFGYRWFGRSAKYCIIVHFSITKSLKRAVQQTWVYLVGQENALRLWKSQFGT